MFRPLREQARSRNGMHFKLSERACSGRRSDEAFDLIDRLTTICSINEHSVVYRIVWHISQA